MCSIPRSITVSSARYSLLVDCDVLPVVGDHRCCRTVVAFGGTVVVVAVEVVPRLHQGRPQTQKNLKRPPHYYSLIEVGPFGGDYSIVWLIVVNRERTHHGEVGADMIVAVRGQGVLAVGFT